MVKLTQNIPIGFFWGGSIGTDTYIYIYIIYIIYICVFFSTFIFWLIVRYGKLVGKYASQDWILWVELVRGLTHTVDGSEIRKSPVEYGSSFPFLQFFKHIPGGCLGFLNHRQYNFVFVDFCSCLLYFWQFVSGELLGDKKS